MATVAELVAATAARTETPPGHVRHIARRLQEADHLPTAVGATVPSVRVSHVASMLLALLSDAQIKNTAAAVETYGALVLDGIDVSVMPVSIRPAVGTVRGYVEMLLRVFATGSPDEQAAARRFTLDVVSNWPEARLFDPGTGNTLAFVEPGADVRRWQGDAVRRSVTITGRALERLVRDLKLSR